MKIHEAAVRPMVTCSKAMCLEGEMKEVCKYSKERLEEECCCPWCVWVLIIHNVCFNYETLISR